MVRVFLVEDEALIRMMIAEMVEELGHRVVAEAGSVKVALQLAQTAEFDLAILDINVGGDSIFPIADTLDERGVPFLFASGYVTIRLPAQFRKCQVLRKPFAIAQLGAAIDLILPAS